MKTITILLGTAFFMLGCNQQPRVQQPVQPKPKKQTRVPAPPPKKNIKLKEVEDENFSSEYMYPQTDKKAAKKEDKVATLATENSSVAAMTNEECIAMIGQEKFERYAQMFGGNAGALKKCKMLKAL